MYENPCIHAIDDVHIEARPGQETRLRFFYGELIGLREVVPPDEEMPSVVFEAHNRRLFVHLFEEAISSPMRRRLVVQVDSLTSLAGRLQDLGLPHYVEHGMGLGSRRLLTLDPADNLVELKELRLL
ncbi:MAG: hypothetical protein JXA69_14790 [Phycisphaerae bacterium]|nr:hypothetical protein [Phycisphaerae bacterium]